MSAIFIRGESMVKKPVDNEMNKLIVAVGELKRLVILKLISDGISDKTIGKVLGVSSARIRQFVPIKEAKRKS